MGMLVPVRNSLLFAPNDQSRAAKIQAWIWIIATVILDIRVGLCIRDIQTVTQSPLFGSLIGLANMLIFGWLVFRCEQKSNVTGRASVPAE